MEQLETISVVPHKERHDDAKPASPSWFVAKINPVSRFIGALILCIPMFVTLDVVSASVALALEVLLLWIGGVAPWTVLRKPGRCGLPLREVSFPCRCMARPPGPCWSISVMSL